MFQVTDLIFVVLSAIYRSLQQVVLTIIGTLVMGTTGWGGKLNENKNANYSADNSDMLLYAVAGIFPPY